jgi:hypothetical protein
VALEPIPTFQDPGIVEPPNRKIFLALGVVGVVGTIVANLLYTVFYLEFLRLLNLGPVDWQDIEFIFTIMNSLASFNLFFAILSSLGFYGVILSSGGKFGLLYILVTVLPHSFNLNQIYIELYGSPPNATLVYLLDMSIAIVVMIIAILILATTRHRISKPKLLYFIIMLMIVHPIISLSLGILSLSGIVNIATGIQYLIAQSPMMIVFYAQMISTIALFIIEFRRVNLQAPKYRGNTFH